MYYIFSTKIIYNEYICFKLITSNSLLAFCDTLYSTLLLLHYINNTSFIDNILL